MRSRTIDRLRKASCPVHDPSEKIRLLALLVAPITLVPLYRIDRDLSLDQLYHTGPTYAQGATGEVDALG
jgi:hypothetical protein